MSETGTLLYSCAFEGAMHAIENMHANEAALTAPVLSNDLDTQPTALLNAPSMVENWTLMIQGIFNFTFITRAVFAKG